MPSENLVHSSQQSQTKATSDAGALLTPDIQLMLLTWLSFVILLVILKRFAWKPILQALDARENTIRQSIEDAEKTRAEYLRIEEKRTQVLTEADNQAKEIMNQSREAALKNAKVIEARTKQEAQIIMENAHREISAEQDKAAAYLKEKSANTAVELASRILRENLDAEKQKKLINTLIEEI